MQTTVSLPAAHDARRQAAFDRRDIRDTIMELTVLSPREKQTLFQLFLCLNDDATALGRWVTHVSNGWLEARTAAGRNSVSASLRALEQDGWIVRVPGPLRRIDLGPAVSRLMPTVRDMQAAQQQRKASRAVSRNIDERQLRMALPTVVGGTDRHAGSTPKTGTGLPENRDHTLTSYPHYLVVHPAS